MVGGVCSGIVHTSSTLVTCLSSLVMVLVFIVPHTFIESCRCGVCRCLQFPTLATCLLSLVHCEYVLALVLHI